MGPNVASNERSTAEDGDNQAAASSPPTIPVAVAAPTAEEQPRCTQRHVMNCQFGQWYPLFKHCTPRSVVVELPEDVVRYLQRDGVVLPKGFEMSCGEGVQHDGDDEVDWGDGDEGEDDDERVRSENLMKYTM